MNLWKIHIRYQYLLSEEGSQKELIPMRTIKYRLLWIALTLNNNSIYLGLQPLLGYNLISS